MADTNFANPAIFTEQSSSPTPPANTVALYPKTDGNFYSKNDLGVETQIGSGGIVPGATLESGTFTNGYTEEVLSTTLSAATYTIDLDNGSIQYLELANSSITFTFPTATAGRSMMIVLKQDAGGNRAVTWPVEVKWAGASTPSLTSTGGQSDVFSFTCISGSSWIGVVVGQNYTL